jgi:catechol 2,3-dioxygenase-like lactoylglutathione lyase family enzyme
MRTAKILLVVLLIGVASGLAFGQSKDVKSVKESRNPLFSAKPYLVSISVANLDETINWYRKNLGFEVIKRIDLPKNSLRIAFVELNGFQLELIEFKQSVSYEVIQKQFPAVDDRAKIQGLGKLAFQVDEIQSAAASLKSNGVKFEREVTDDKQFGVKWFIVTDNSGNWIQFFQKMK